MFVDMSCPRSVNFTRAQLEKLHKNFFHPSVEKLFNLIKRARPDEATQETRQILEEVSSNCDLCQRIKIGPKRFGVALGSENKIFNESVPVSYTHLTLPTILLV